MAARRETLRVKGYREFMRAAAKAPADTRKEVRAALRDVGDIVKAEAATRFEPYSAKAAAGFRTSVRQRGVAVQQKLRKKTGTRPDFGSLQMTRALEPALEAKEGEVEREMEEAMDRVADRFDR